jgi:hypothetical protein
MSFDQGSVAHTQSRARAWVAVSLQIALPVVGAAVATSWLVGLASNPAASSAPEPPVAFAAASFAQTCDAQSWPYVDQRCATEATAGSTRQIRVVSTDRSAPLVVFTQVAPVRVAVARAPQPVLAAAVQPAATPARIQVTALPVADIQAAKLKVAADTSRSAKRSKASDRSARIAQNGSAAGGRSYGVSLASYDARREPQRARGLDTLAYGDTDRPPVRMESSDRNSGSLFSVLFANR